MATHTILLLHSESGDTVTPAEVKVDQNDILRISAKDANFEVCPSIGSGNYTQNGILVTPQSPLEVRIITLPTDIDIFEVRCLAKHSSISENGDDQDSPIPPEYLTPSKIIVVRASLEENVVHDRLNLRLARMQKLIDSFYELKKPIS